jgi:hypothetical protein
MEPGLSLTFGYARHSMALQNQHEKQSGPIRTKTEDLSTYQVELLVNQWFGWAGAETASVKANRH